MHLLQYKLCTGKNEFALRLKCYLDFHWVTRPLQGTLINGNDVKRVFPRWRETTREAWFSGGKARQRRETGGWDWRKTEEDWVVPAFGLSRPRRPLSLGSLKQTRTATATWGARKRLFRYFWGLCNSACSYLGSNFFRFCQSFYCFNVSNYGRATVVISRNDAHVLTTTYKWSNWSRTWGTTTPRSCQFHIFTCGLLFSAISLIVSLSGRCRRGRPSWSLRPVYTCDFWCDFDAILMRFCAQNLPQPTPHGFLIT